METNETFSSGNISHPTDAEILGFAVNTTLLVILGLQGCIAITTNLITIIVVTKYTFLSDEPTSRFVVSLASADLLAGLAAFLDITLTSNLELNSTSWLIMCKIKLCIALFSIIGNVYNGLFVTIDRFLYMIKPMRYVSIVTTFRASVSILCLWSVVAVHVVMFLILDYDVNTYDKVCSFTRSVSKTGRFVIITEYSIIFITVILAYCKIILTVQHLKKTQPHISNYPPEQRLNQMKKLRQYNMSITLGFVLGTFIISNTIPMIYNLVVAKVFDFDRFSFNGALTNRIAKLIFWAQYMLNIFIYGWRNKSFRKAYKKLFHIRETNTDVLFGNLS